MENQIREYCKLNGAIQVWSTWRSKMISQGRDVSNKFHSWPIPARDIELDSLIAFDVIDDFLVWIGTHHQMRLIKTGFLITKSQALLLAEDELDDVQFIDNNYREGISTKKEVLEIINRLADRLTSRQRR
jgi:hypothetical protein